ncbi:jg8743 [Pararge aegeria aegeria]|uniref:Jg8743 protein n=1 Tax=Pararge aegeria aegeria TaxID=348720 RepID=A0A8S4R134_9NEOP|nr:jg8743 [Pararge aegeria aegeria]
MGDRPPDPGGTIPPGSVNIPSKMDILISAVESSMDTDASAVSNAEQTLKRKIFSRVCTMCKKKKRKGKANYEKDKFNDCMCESHTDDVPNRPNKNPNISPNHKPTEPTSPIDNNKPSLSTIPTNVPTRVPIGRAQYQKSDSAPYVVHVNKEYENSDSSTTLHPITFGRFLQRNKFDGVVNGSLKRVGRNRISMAFSSYMDANKFLLHQSLGLEKYSAFIPTFNVTRMGVVRGVPNDWSDEEILSNINVPLGCGPIIKIRRIKRKVTVNNVNQFISTGTVIITFDGQVLPTRVYMCYTALSVELYIYPTVQCYQCCRFGHVKNQCRSLPKCYKCGQGHSGDTCQVEEEDYRCCLCNGSHQAIDKKCLEHNRQRAIKETMSKSCISYMEAIKMHPPVSKMS